MNTPAANHIQQIYLGLTFLSTLAASLIWGINTLFLLDGGLSNIEAFASNAFFTLGQVVFEVPTGIIADTLGRRVSYLLGTVSLAVSTLLYYVAWQMQAPFWMWASISVLLGLGFTFFSGATEAWLVDALAATKFKGRIESVFAKAQVVGGIAMLSGALLGGIIAQATNLGVPYILRGCILAITFVVTYLYMHDRGFSPSKGASYMSSMKAIVRVSVQHGFGNRPVRWLMLAAPFTTGVSIYGFYALQPYLLELYGDSGAYGIAGLAASIVAGAQIIGGLVVPHIHKVVKNRSSILLSAVCINVVVLALIGLTQSFWIVLGLIVIWGLVFSASMPVRQAFINGLIPSKQRATVLSFDSLIGSTGGIVAQPVLGRVADVYGYASSYLVTSCIQICAIPFVYLAKRENASSDRI